MVLQCVAVRCSVLQCVAVVGGMCNEIWRINKRTRTHTHACAHTHDSLSLSLSLSPTPPSVRDRFSTYTKNIPAIQYLKINLLLIYKSCHIHFSLKTRIINVCGGSACAYAREKLTPQHTLTHWDTLRHTATHCNTLQLRIPPAKWIYNVLSASLVLSNTYRLAL